MNSSGNEMSVGRKPKQGESQDIISFTPAPVKILRDKETLEILEDPAYYLIIKVLRKGPMTVRDLDEAYNRAAAEDKKYESKSDKTLYRYLKHLEKVDLVIPAGKRIAIGKTASETLFARTAIVFMTHPETSEWWTSEAGMNTVERVAIGLEQLHGRKVSIPCLGNILRNLESAKQSEIEALVSEGERSALESITSGDWDEVDKSLGLIKLLSVLLNKSEIIDELRTCLA